MSRYNRAGGVFDINRSLRKTREEFERAYEDVAAVVSKNTEKGSGNMSENINESKRHYIADEELGGIDREYVEVDADDVGDIAVYDDGDNFHVLSPGYFSTYEKTDIIRHNGERYRLVDRKAEVGEKVIAVENGVFIRAGDIYDGENPYAYNRIGIFNVLEPVIDEQEADAPPEPQPDLIDLVIRLTRKVAELEKEISAMGDVFERRDSWFEHRLSVVKKTADNADYKAGQALTSTSQFTEKLTDSEILVKLDGRTVARVIMGSADE